MRETDEKDMKANPMVSVVIPTFERPELVIRAVKSVMAQTLTRIEILVITDGPDPITESALSGLNDPRIKVLSLPFHQGVALARNKGVAAAKGEWIAFLDDDDEWFPEKLEKQWEKASCSKHALPVIASFLIARTSFGEYVCPRRELCLGEKVGDFLFLRDTFFQRGNQIQTSTLFLKKALFEKNGFNKTLGKHEDWEWLLKAVVLPGVGIEIVPRPLVIWHLDAGRKRASRDNNWQFSLNWIRSCRFLVSKKAYAAFILWKVSQQAMREHRWKVFFLLLKEAFKNGSPRALDLFYHLCLWLIPRALGSKLKIIFKMRD